MNKQVLLLILFFSFILPLNAYADITTGLAGWWKFDGGTSGSIANNTTLDLTDASGNGNNGTASNANGTGMAWVPGKIRGAVRFDGVDDYVNVPHTATQVSAAWTVAAWAKPLADNNTALWGSDIINKALNGAYFYRNMMFKNLKFESLYCTAGGISTVVSPPVVLNRWYHVAITYDGSDVMALYVNGTLGAPIAHVGAILSGPQPMTIGTRTGAFTSNDEFFNGYIDDVRFYTRALDPGDVQELYRLGITRVRGATLHSATIR